MSTLKSFMVNEELKVNHAERYMLYVDRYHSEILLDLKKHLEAAWTAVLKLKRTYKPKEQAIQDAQLRNPDASIELKLSTVPEKVVSSRSRGPFEVSPSLKIPFVYSHEERSHLIKKALAASEEALKKTATSWREIFNYEKNSQLKPWFKITTDGDEVRFQLAMTHGKSETYKTLYSVRVEYGKTGTKTRDFDRIYLCNLIS